MALHLREEPCTTVSVAHRVDVVPGTRRQMQGELTAHGLAPETVQDAAVVLAELLANAVEHGSPNSEGEVEVSWCLHDDVLRISVMDGGNVAKLRPVQFTSDSLRGRGLHLVDFLCERWSTDNENGTRVTAELSLG